MRVLVSRRDESGAIAIVVALLSVFLLGMTAFVADIGLAYANKRQAQTAADAGALAAAGVFATHPGTCSVLNVDGTTPYDEAEANAGNRVSDNAPPSAVAASTTLEDFDVSCPNDVLTVKTKVVADSPSIFGKVFGLDDYPVMTTAAAVVEVPGEVKALRPMALCSKDLNGYTGGTPSKVLKLTQPGNGGVSSNCVDAQTGGNWWTINCPEDGSSSDLVNNITNGCDDAVSVVPGQPSVSDPATAAEAAALSSHLTNACPNKSSTCLGADTGNDMGNSGTTNAWRNHVLSGDPVILPVFCAAPTCVPAAVNGTGNNTIYPVQKFVSVQVCGYHFGNRRSTTAMMTGDCGAANNPDAWDPQDGDNNHNYLLGVIKQMQVSGTIGPATCKVGDVTCDGGLRRVRLSE